MPGDSTRLVEDRAGQGGPGRRSGGAVAGGASAIAGGSTGRRRPSVDHSGRHVRRAVVRVTRRTAWCAPMCWFTPGISLAPPDRTRRLDADAVARSTAFLASIDDAIHAPGGFAPKIRLLPRRTPQAGFSTSPAGPSDSAKAATGAEHPSSLGVAARATDPGCSGAAGSGGRRVVLERWTARTA